jgi:MFS transporter, Spinster family, sphingosine-1-phosphate transporter
MSENNNEKKFLKIFAVFLIVALAVFNYVNRAILVPNARYILMDLYNYTAVEVDTELVKITNLHTIFKWSAAACTILYGYLNDKFQRKRILSVGALIYGICALLTAYVQSYSQLVLMQILTAMAIGASLPTSYSILSDMYPPGKRGKIFGVFGLSTIFGDIFGNLMVSLVFPATLDNLANWRQPFLVCGAISLVLTVLIIIFVQEPKRGSNEDSLKELLTDESIEYSHRIKKEDLKDVWKNKSNRWLILNFIDNITGGFILATAIDWLRQEHGAEPEVAGMLVLIPALAIIGGTLFWGIIGDKWFKRDKAGRVIVCIICLSISSIFLPIAVSRPFDLTGLDLGQTLANAQFQFAFAIFFIFFFFNNGIGPGWNATIIDINKVEVRGSILSVATFFEEFGEGLGILIGGLVYRILAQNNITTPYGTTYLWLTVFLVLGVVMWIPLYKNVRSDIAKVEEYNKNRALELDKNTPIEHTTE